MVRVLKARQDEVTRTLIDRIYQTYSGYVHAKYAHIMEVYNGITCKFKLHGVPSVEQREMRMQLVEQAALTLVNAAAFTAYTLGQPELQQELIKLAGPAFTIVT